MMTVDGTDFRIEQPTPFATRWFSHKFKGPGLRYEVAMSINGGDVVWTNGPFPCGSWPDITIFREGLMDKLLPMEMVEADKGYRGQPDKIRTPDDFQSREEKKRKKRASSRHETVNRRFKQFNILKKHFRHDLQDHQKVFRSVVVLTQLSIRNREVLFACDYE
jgi:DDE superfamily endonuclease